MIREVCSGLHMRMAGRHLGVALASACLCLATCARPATPPCVARTAFLGGRVRNRTIFDVDSAVFRFDGALRHASPGGWLAMRPAWPGPHTVEVEITLRGRASKLFPYLRAYTTRIAGSTVATAVPGCAVDVVATAADPRNPHDRPYVYFESRRACDVPAEDIPEPEPPPADPDSGSGVEARAAYGRECILRAAVARAHLERALETARIQRDIVWVVCLSSKVEEIDSVRAQIERTLEATPDAGTDERERTLERLCGRIADLQAEARGCI